jgi:hypothetical protein
MVDTFVTVVGNLTEDPELRFTPNGTAVAHFRLAVTPRIREGDTWRMARPPSSGSTHGESSPPTSQNHWARATAPW